MRIGIDASKLVSPKPTGVERTARLLLKNLFDLDRDNEYLLFTPQALPPEFHRPSVVEKIVPSGGFWTLLRLSEALEKEKPDLFFQPGNVLPLKLPSKVVLTIHDLAALKLSRAYPPREVVLSYLTGLQAARRASKIVAVSENTKEDLKKLFVIPERKIEVIYHGPPRGYLKKTGKTPTLVGKNFFLVVGRVELRKNILRILEAYHLYRSQGGESKLVFAGAPGFGYEKFTRRLRELELPNVVMLGFVEDGVLDGLFTNAKALVFPSLYEGFGLPILEAFSYGLPVITSNLGATKEIARDAALLVNSESVEEIASAMKKVESDVKLRELLIKRGKRRLQDFSWVKAAQKLLALFEGL